MLPKIRGMDKAFFEDVAGDKRLRTMYGPLPRKCRGHTLEAFTFAILSSSERTDLAEEALEKLKAVKFAVNRQAIEGILLDTGMMYWRNKASYLTELYARPVKSLRPLRSESCSQYRDRVFAMKVKGLGFCKTSFAAYLSYGGGDVACIDRHMIAIHSGTWKEWMFRRSKKAEAFQRDIESQLVSLAKKYHWRSASALQWACWCEAQKIYTEHRAVWR